MIHMKIAQLCTYYDFPVFFSHHYIYTTIWGCLENAECRNVRNARNTLRRVHARLFLCACYQVEKRLGALTIYCSGCSADHQSPGDVCSTAYAEGLCGHIIQG